VPGGGGAEKELKPVAVVDAVTGLPLMLAYADEEALELTAETGLAHFYSRSRGRLWLKGQGSGSLLRVLQVLLDCDGDAAAYVAYTERHVCHLGRSSCFHRILADERMRVLEELLEETRPNTRVEGGRVLHPLTTWSPPPSPLLARLAAWLLAEEARKAARPTAVLAAGEGALLGLLVAQLLRARLHVASCDGAGCVAPESLGEEDAVLVLARWPAEEAPLLEAARRRGAVVAASLVVASPRGEGGAALLQVEPGEPWPRLSLALGGEDAALAEDSGGGRGQPGV